jgi:hypothetical protein
MHPFQVASFPGARPRGAFRAFFTLLTDEERVDAI